MGILVVVAAGCYTFGNHRTKAVSPRGLAEAYFFSPLKKKRPPGLLSSHVPEQIKTLTSFWGHHGWLGMQPTREVPCGAAVDQRAGCGHPWLDHACGGALCWRLLTQVLSVQECGLGAHAMEGELSTTSADFSPRVHTRTVTILQYYTLVH